MAWRAPCPAPHDLWFLASQPSLRLTLCVGKYIWATAASGDMGVWEANSVKFCKSDNKMVALRLDGCCSWWNGGGIISARFGSIAHCPLAPSHSQTEKSEASAIPVPVRVTFSLLWGICCFFSPWQLTTHLSQGLEMSRVVLFDSWWIREPFSLTPVSFHSGNLSLFSDFFLSSYFLN